MSKKAKKKKKKVYLFFSSSSFLSLRWFETRLGLRDLGGGEREELLLCLLRRLGEDGERVLLLRRLWLGDRLLRLKNRNQSHESKRNVKGKRELQRKKKKRRERTLRWFGPFGSGCDGEIQGTESIFFCAKVTATSSEPWLSAFHSLTRCCDSPITQRQLEDPNSLLMLMMQLLHES